MTDKTNAEPIEDVVKFHDDPAADSALRRLNTTAANYRELVSLVTGKFDENFTEWKGAIALSDATGAKVPDLSKVEEWTWDASPIELLAFGKMLENLRVEVTRELFARYARKTDRADRAAKLDTTQDIGKVRSKLIDTLNAVVTMIEGGNYPIDGVTMDHVFSLPAVGKMKDRGDGLVWDFPNAPRNDDTETKTSTVRAFRANNTTVKFVVDGALPTEDTKLNLGQLCLKYFGENATAQNVATKFDTWSDEYFVKLDGDKFTESTKVVERDGVRFALTNYGK